MRLSKPLLRAMAAMGAVVTAAGVVAAMAAPASAATPADGTPLPTHVFAPYFEAYSGDNLATAAQNSGNKYLTMAFIQTASTGSCTPTWDGDTTTPIAATTFGNDIAKVRAMGGDVIPSFGGFTADDTATEIADSCTDVTKIAAAYENVITTYNVTRLDLDTEDNSLTNTAGIDRRNKAIKMVEDWAATNGRTVQFSYTLPSAPTGLVDTGLNVLQNAIQNNARIDVVNIMTFDYFDNQTHEMANDTESAANGLIGELQNLYPNKTTNQLWSMVGITDMVGIDDFGPAETFTLPDATTVENFAASKGINFLSFWALERDNGSCVGTKGMDGCSGIQQNTWDFSHAFQPFTSGTTTPPPPMNDFSVAVNPGSATVNAGSSASATINTAVTNGTAQSVNLTASGAPAGVTVSISPTSVTAGGSATLNISTAATTAAGSYPITVTGTSSASSHAVTYTLMVTGTTGGGGCAGVSPWSATTTYTGGMSVSFNGHMWTAKWWTFGDTPGGPAGVWTDNGAC